MSSDTHTFTLSNKARIALVEALAEAIVLERRPFPPALGCADEVDTPAAHELELLAEVICLMKDGEIKITVGAPCADIPYEIPPELVSDGKSVSQFQLAALKAVDDARLIYERITPLPLPLDDAPQEH